METIFFNILVRTSGRPNYFADCINSIRKQTFKNYQILVSYDTTDTYEYVKTYENIQVIAVEPSQIEPKSRAVEPRHTESFLPNLYFNSLLQHIRSGFILFLDDDDAFLENEALENIKDQITGPDDLLFWRVRFSQNRLIPSNANFGQAPVYRQINTSGFAFHSKYVGLAQWDAWRGSDYFVASKLYQNIPNKFYIDRALTGLQDQHCLPGRGLRNDKAITVEGMKAQFERMGYLPPVRVLTVDESYAFLKQAQALPKELPLDWRKGYAANSRSFFEIAIRPAIMDRVSMLLGPNVILWGCSIVVRPAGSSHPWHCDIEASTPPHGRTLNVWVGLKNLILGTGLSVIPFSHTFDKTIQQIRHEKGIGRGQSGEAQVLEWAKERNPAVKIMRPDMTDGEALFFDGKMWHGSFNKTKHDRYAILIQYATPDAAIRLPDHNNFEWPFRQLKEPRPPVILIQGDDHAGVNRVVQAPPSQRSLGAYLMSANRIYPLKLPLFLPKHRNWRPFHIFNGTTANLQHITCHVSALAPGHMPHPPHTHKEEEILMVLEGEAEIILPELAGNDANHKRLSKGDFVYYPSHFQHTLRGLGDKPVNYLMFKWYNAMHSPMNQLSFGKYHGISKQTEGSGRPVNFNLLFEGPTTSLKKLHSHTSVLQPGASYAAHRDPYDVAIVVMEGQVETLGQLVGTHQVIFYPAGTLHGMANPGDQIARYVVFEFHGQQALQDRQIKPIFPEYIPSQPVHQAEDTRYELLLQEYKALKSSYSFKFGRAITKTVERYLAWVPSIKKIISKVSQKK